MRFVIGAMRNRTFLCAAIVVNAVVVILADMSSKQIPFWEGWDISELLIVLLGIAYLRTTDHDDEFRRLLKGVPVTRAVHAGCCAYLRRLTEPSHRCSPFMARPGRWQASRGALLHSGLRRSVVPFLAEPLRQPHGFNEFFRREWFASDLLVDELVETGQRHGVSRRTLHRRQWWPQGPSSRL